MDSQVPIPPIGTYPYVVVGPKLKANAQVPTWGKNQLTVIIQLSTTQLINWHQQHQAQLPSQTQVHRKRSTQYYFNQKQLNQETHRPKSVFTWKYRRIVSQFETKLTTHWKPKEKTYELVETEKRQWIKTQKHSQITSSLA